MPLYHLIEKPMDELVRRVNPGPRFSGHYDGLRPFAVYCREVIAPEKGENG